QPGPQPEPDRLEPERTELVVDVPGGLVLLVGQFRVRVDVPPPGPELLLEASRRGGVLTGQVCGHRTPSGSTPPPCRPGAGGGTTSRPHDARRDPAARRP